VLREVGRKSNKFLKMEVGSTGSTAERVWQRGTKDLGEKSGRRIKDTISTRT